MKLANPQRLTLSMQSLKLFLFTFFVFVFVFIRFILAKPPFSYDYGSYLVILDVLDGLSFSDIIGKNLEFPYTVANGITPIEIGFALFVKAISLPGFSIETDFAIIAAASVALRVYLMRKIGMPIIWILAINAIAISLLEANALRLGIAISVLLWGLFTLRAGHRIMGLLLVAASASLHLQVVLFAAPFLFFLLLSRWVNRSKYHFALSLMIVMSFAIFSAQIFPMLANEKVQEYVRRGVSGSAGNTVTSILAALLLATSTFALRKRTMVGADEDFFAAILVASVPSVAMLIILTNIAVIGDRAWQLAFLVLSTFFFSDWANNYWKKLVFYVLIALIFVLLINVIFRYPLSNFFSPPAPSISYL